MDYYDKILLGILAMLALGGLTSVHPAIAFHEGLGAGSLISTLMLYEILFRNPPTEAGRSRAGPSAVVMVGWLATILAAL